MLNPEANELVCRVARQLHLLSGPGHELCYHQVQESLALFARGVIEMADSQPGQVAWKEAFGRLYRLSRELTTMCDSLDYRKSA